VRTSRRQAARQRSLACFQYDQGDHAADHGACSSDALTKSNQINHLDAAVQGRQGYQGGKAEKNFPSNFRGHRNRNRLYYTLYTLYTLITLDTLDRDKFSAGLDTQRRPNPERQTRRRGSDPSCPSRTSATKTRAP
jgi:hypothetical protein